MRLVGSFAAVNGNLGFGLLRTKLLRLPCHIEPRKPQRGFRFWNVRPRWKTPLLSTAEGRRRVSCPPTVIGDEDTATR